MNIIHIKRTWEGEYVFSGRNKYIRERRCLGLKDLIEERFNEKIHRISRF